MPSGCALTLLGQTRNLPTWLLVLALVSWGFGIAGKGKGSFPEAQERAWISVLFSYCFLIFLPHLTFWWLYRLAVRSQTPKQSDTRMTRNYFANAAVRLEDAHPSPGLGPLLWSVLKEPAKQEKWAQRLSFYLSWPTDGHPVGVQEINNFVYFMSMKKKKACQALPLGLSL